MDRWLITYSVVWPGEPQQLYTTIFNKPDPKPQELEHLIQHQLIGAPIPTIQVWGSQKLEEIATTYKQ